jgi:preprotein translocase subunit SecG
MSTVFSLLILITCILLILIVLVQNSKGGGLASTFSASNQVMGVRKTTDFLEKATWTLAGTLIVLCLLATALKTSSTGGETETISTRKAEEGTSAPAPAAPKVPAQKAPAPAPKAP